jgi:hypothetical protein
VDIEMSTEPRERRLVLRILSYWRACRGDRSFPDAVEIRDDGLGDDAVFCFRLDLPRGVEEAVLVSLGQHYAGDWSDLVGRPVSECPAATILGATVALTGKVLAQRVPITIGSEAIHRGAPVLFRSILLPLSGDDDRIDGFLGAANYRAADGPQ